MSNPHSVTLQFERLLSDYTGAPYVLAVDSCTSALRIALELHRRRWDGLPDSIGIPCHTYPSVPCVVIQSGCKVQWLKSSPILRGEYQLRGTSVWDSALRFTAGMYRPGDMQCLSFSGPHKRLPLGKGGAILLDDSRLFWLGKQLRNSGRSECSYHDELLSEIGWNAYMLPEIAARGVMAMARFFDPTGQPIPQDDLALPYPNLSLHPAYRK